MGAKGDFESVGIANIIVRKGTAMRIHVVNIRRTKVRVSDRHRDGVGHDMTGRIALSHPYGFARGSMAKDLGVKCCPPVLSNFKILQDECCRSFGDDDTVSQGVIGSGRFGWFIVSSC